MSDPNLDPKNKIFARYNLERQNQNLLPIDINDYDFGLPAVYSGARSTKNTRIHLVPKLLSSQFSKIAIYYDRIDLNSIDPLDRRVNQNVSFTNTLEYLNEINESLGVEMQNSDIENSLSDSLGFTLTASMSNYAFFGSAAFTYF